MKILVVDDNQVIRMSYSYMLKYNGHEVLEADNGENALSILSIHKDISLVLTDWRMPELCGLGLTRAIREKITKNYVYIVIITGEIDKEAIIEGFKAGADEFLFKPVRYDELVLRIQAAERIIELKKAYQAGQRELQRTYENLCKELQMAAQMQRALLPHKGVAAGFRFDWLFEPCGYVAGDVFNYFSLGTDYFGFYQIDVVGHGISAALLSVTLYHQLAGGCMDKQSLTQENKVPILPSQILARLNTHFQSPDVSQYFSIVYGYLEHTTGRVCLARAGHPKPIHLKTDGTVQIYEEGGIPIGMFPDVEYHDVEFELAKGDRLFIYSDGLTESENSTGMMLSEAYFLEFLQKYADNDLDKLLQLLKNELISWHGSLVLDDDVSLLAIEHIREHPEG